MRRSLGYSVGLAMLASVCWSLDASAGGGPWFNQMDMPDPLSPQACGGTGCWTNYLRVTDIDGNDTLDLVLVNYSGFFSAGTAQPLVVYDNDGAANFTNVSDTAVGNFSGRVREVAIGDVDGDGDPDMYVPSAQADGDAFFINDGLGVFTDEVDARLPGLNSRAGAARFFDADSDGDLDLFLADGYATNSVVFGHLYLNDGDGGFTEQGGAFPASIDGQDIDDVDIFDADRDFDLDVLINVHQGNNSLWINDGTGSFTDASDDLPNAVTMNFHYNPGVCDVDGDGDLDIWVDNIGGNFQEQLLINDGTGVFTDETGGRVSGNTAEDDNGVGCADIDNDGDFDAVVYSLSEPERYFENDGSGGFTFMGGVFPNRTDSTLWGEFGDLDADGRVDLVTGQGEGTTEERIDLANQAVPVDNRPPVIIDLEAPPASVAAMEELPLRYAVSDRVVTDEGPRLSGAFARVIVDGGFPSNVDAAFMGGDLFRVVVPGQTSGSVVEVELCATDRQDNEGCLAAGTYQVGDAPETSGTTDEPTGGTDSASASASASGTTDSGTSGSASDTASDSAASDTVSTAATDGDTETDTAGATDDDSGCSCRASEPTPLTWAWLGLPLFARRRRR